MYNLLRPKWIFLINTLPIIVLLVLGLEQYKIINTLLDEESKNLWKLFGLALGIICFSNVIITTFLILKNKRLSVWYAIANLVLSIAFIYIYSLYFDDIIPFSAPRWMVSENVFIYVGTFIMPSLLYFLCVIVIRFTANASRHKAWKNFLIALGIPLLVYILTQTIFPFWKIIDSNFGQHLAVIFFITITLIFFFFLIRSVFILVNKKSSIFKKYQLVWKIPLTLLLPLIGLGINNGSLFNQFVGHGSGLFGNFNNYWFFILATLNGILLCLPIYKIKSYRLLILFLKCITFTFSLYFLLVFIPFFPFSVLLIAFVGLGFFMLTPIIVFVIHTHSISEDFKYLKAYYPRRILYSTSALGVVLIPFVLTLVFMHHKSVLNECLSYVYQPNYAQEYNISDGSLKKTIETIKTNKTNNWAFQGIYGTRTPYISSYYNWLVLDNLTLSENKINLIESVFFGTKKVTPRRQNLRNKNVNISSITSTSSYDDKQHYWTSWIDLKITNSNDSTRFAEYATTIDLPEGCWISDYYLYVGDRKEYGILAEKKSALWVFNQIRGRNRDPGLLYYLTGNKVAFRVFPFLKNEVRRTGIQLIHKEPITIDIDNYSLSLGKHEETYFESIENDDLIFVSSEDKTALKSISRQPYYHFLIDISKDKAEHIPDYKKRINYTLKNNTKLAKNAKFSFVNAFEIPLENPSIWEDELEKQSFKHGFYLDRAIKTLLLEAHQTKKETYPVFVVVTDSLENAIIDKDFSDFEFTFPENNIFLHLDENYALNEHSLIQSPLKRMPELKRECIFCEEVLLYTSKEGDAYYVKSDSQPSFILKNENIEIDDVSSTEDLWNSALVMHANVQAHKVNPRHYNKEWLSLIRESFRSNVMNAYTSFIVVENEAQKQALLNKQEEVLSGKKYQDVDEETQSMSEPGLWIMGILFTLFVFRNQIKRKIRLVS